MSSRFIHYPPNYQTTALCRTATHTARAGLAPRPNSDCKRWRNSAVATAAFGGFGGCRGLLGPLCLSAPALAGEDLVPGVRLLQGLAGRSGTSLLFWSARDSAPQQIRMRLTLVTYTSSCFITGLQLLQHAITTHTTPIITVMSYAAINSPRYIHHLSKQADLRSSSHRFHTIAIRAYLIYPFRVHS